MHTATRHRTARWRPVAVVLALTVLACGCGGGDDAADGDPAPGTAAEGTGGGLGAPDVNLVVDAGTPRPGGRLVYGLSSETDGWNPTLSRWSPAGMQVARSIFDLLVVVDEEGGWQPELAAAFEPSDDFRTWTIRLRPDVTFHDGSPLDAEALAAYLRYLQDSPLTGVTMYLVEEVAVEGDAVVVRMAKPWATYPYAFTTQIGAVAEPTWLATGSPTDPVGTGPFTFEEWVPDEVLRVTRNDAWWRDGYPLLDEVEFRPTPDELARESGLADGDLDVVQASQGAQIARLRAAAEAGDVQLACGVGSETIESFAMLNLGAPPFDDPDVRRAVALATDADAVRAAMGGEGDELEAATSPYSPSSPWYVATDFPTFDPEAASRLVADIEARTGQPLAVTISASPSPETVRQSQLIAEQWQAAGIDVEIVSLELPLLIRNVLFGDYQSVVWQQFDAPHPLADTIWWSPLASAAVPEVALNFARNDDPELVPMLEAAMAEPDRTRQRELYGEIQQRINDALPYVWLYHTRQCVAARTDVVDLVRWTTPEGATGLEIMGGSHPLWQVWLDR